MGDQRREKIMDLLNNTSKPLSGSKLGEVLEVSRQVIVQDVALLRAQGLDIIATARGYLLYKNRGENKQRVVLVCHNFNEIADELNTAVDFGGVIRNVIVEHPVYGEMIGNMMIKTRRDVEEFVEEIEKADTYPLMTLTSGVHMHTIEADNEEILDKIEEELEKKGYLYTGP